MSGGLSESDPVGADEFVYRRIPRSYYDPSLESPVSDQAFKAWPRDVTGLSLFRAEFCSPEQVAKNTRKGWDDHVARFRVQELIDLGLSVVPDPDSKQLPGHSLIPELVPGADKEWASEMQLQLALLAKDRIVYPLPVPTA